MMVENQARAVAGQQARMPGVQTPPRPSGSNLRRALKRLYSILGTLSMIALATIGFSGFFHCVYGGDGGCTVVVKESWSMHDTVVDWGEIEGEPVLRVIAEGHAPLIRAMVREGHIDAPFGDSDRNRSDIVTDFEGIKDRMCECTTKSCAESVNREFEDWLKRNEKAKGSARQQEDAKRIAEEYTRCMMSAMTNR
jgi:hypothetical protein